MHRTLTRLVARLTHLPSESQEAILCTHMIMGQLAVFKTHREMILRRSSWKTYGEQETQAVIKMLLQNMDAIIATHKLKDKS